MFCPSCGHEAVETGNFCVKCGAAFGEVPAVKTVEPRLPTYVMPPEELCRLDIKRYKYLGNKEASFDYITGVVLGQHNDARTELSVSGGGASVAGRYVTVHPVNMSAYTITNEHFWLCTLNGKEVEITLSNSGVALRPGQFVSIILLSFDKMDSRYCAQLVNHSTGTQRNVLGLLPGARSKLHLLMYAVGAFAIAGVFFAGFIVAQFYFYSGLLMIASGPASLIYGEWGRRRYNKFSRKLKARLGDIGRWLLDTYKDYA